MSLLISHHVAQSHMHRALSPVLTRCCYATGVPSGRGGEEADCCWLRAKEASYSAHHNVSVVDSDCPLRCAMASLAARSSTQSVAIVYSSGRRASVGRCSARAAPRCGGQLAAGRSWRGLLLAWAAVGVGCSWRWLLLAWAAAGAGCDSAPADPHLGTSASASSRRNNPTSVTTPTACAEPRSTSFVTTAGLMSTHT